MLFIRGIYDSNSKKMVFEFSNAFIDNYFNILEKSIKKRISDGTLPSDLEIIQMPDNKCRMSFHIDLPNREHGSVGKLPSNISEPIVSAIDEFRVEAIKLEFKTTEFIPLAGYPLKDLQKDVKEAIKKKRNFCIIDDYSEYLRFERGETTKLNQAKVNFLSNEYSDVAIYIHEGNMKKLKDIFKDKLTEVDWN